MCKKQFIHEKDRLHHVGEEHEKEMDAHVHKNEHAQRKGNNQKKEHLKKKLVSILKFGDSITIKYVF